MPKHKASKHQVLGAGGVVDIAFLLAFAGYEPEAEACIPLCRRSASDRLLLEYTAHIQHAPRMRTRLMYNAWRGKTERVQLLLESGARCSVPDAEGQTAATWACLGQHAATAHLLCAAPDYDTARDLPTSVWLGLIDRVRAGLALLRDALAVDGAADGEVPRRGAAIVTTLAAAMVYQPHMTDIATALIEHARVDDLPLNDRVADGLTVLIFAVKQCRADIVQQLLACRGVDVNATTAAGAQTALHWAAALNQTEILQLLLAAPGVQVNAADSKGRTALIYAALRGLAAPAAALVAWRRPVTEAQADADVGAAVVDVNVKTRDGETALSLAAAARHEGVVTALLAAPGLDVGALKADRTSASVVAEAAAETGAPAVLLHCLRLLQEDVALHTSVVHSGLRRAAARGQVSTVTLLCELQLQQEGEEALQVADVNVKDKLEGCTPLQLAAREGHADVVSYLLTRAGVLVNEQNKQGMSALMLAAVAGHESVVATMLSKLQQGQLHLRQRNARGETALMLAAAAGHEHVVHLLLSGVADPCEELQLNAVDNDGFTALMRAVTAGHTAAAVRLAAVPAGAGVDVNARSKAGGGTPLTAAVRAGSAASVAALLAAPGVNVNTADEHGLTPLLLAVVSRQVEIVKLLLSVTSGAGKGCCDVNALCTVVQSRVADVAVGTARTLLQSELPRGRSVQPQEPKQRVECSTPADEVWSAATEGSDMTENVALTPLIAAVRTRDLATLHALLSQAPGRLDVNAADMAGTTALMTAVQLPQRSFSLHFADMPPYQQKEEQRQVQASEARQRELMTALLAAPGINVNARNKEQHTALSQAICVGAAAAVSVLLAARGVDVKAVVGPKRETPLLTAIRAGRLPIVLQLLATPGVDVNTPSANGDTPLIALAGSSGFGWNDRDQLLAVVALLVVPGLHVNATAGASGITALMKAADVGNTATVSALLATPGVDVNAADEGGCTALMWAVRSRHTDTAEVLLAAPGVNAAARSTGGVTVLMTAAANGCDDMVARLLASPACRPATSAASATGTAAADAATSGTSGPSNGSTGAHLDVNAVNAQGLSALMMACSSGHMKVVKQLLAVPAVQAQVNAATPTGHTSLMLAAAGGHVIPVVALLTTPGIDVNAAEQQGLTALMLAAAKDHVAVVKQLLRAPGIAVNANSKSGDTAVTVAANCRATEVLGLLLADARVDQTALLAAQAAKGHSAGGKKSKKR